MYKIIKFVAKQIKDISEKGPKTLIFKVILLFNITVKKLLIISFIIFVPFIFLLKRFFNFHFYELQTERIGCYSSWEPFIILTHYKRNLRNKDLNLCLIYHNKVVANNYLTDLYKNKMKSLGNYRFLKGYFFWECLTSSYKFWTGRKIKTYFFNRITMYPMFVKTDRMLKLPNKDIEKGHELLEKLKIPINSKWICIHNRDSSYLESLKRKNYLKHVDFSYHNVRDFKVDDLLPAANYFTKKGYYVIRVGAISNQKIISDNPKIIDLVNSNHRNDFADIFFFSNCEFYFGSTSGSWKIAKIFRKPAFLINGFPFADLFLMPWKYPGIFKKLKIIKENRFMTINEMVKKDLNHFNSKPLLNKMGIEVINNSPKEILELAIEAEEFFRLGKNKNKTSEKLNKIYSELNKSGYKNYKYYKNPLGLNFLNQINL